MNKVINNALMKAVAQALFLRFYEAPRKDDNPIAQGPLPPGLQRAILTAFVLQIVSVFDDGLDEVWLQKRPGTTPPTLGAKVNQLAAWNEFVNGQEAKDIVDFRNQLAHESGVEADWRDWHRIHGIVKRELGHLGLVYPQQMPDVENTRPE